MSWQKEVVRPVSGSRYRARSGTWRPSASFSEEWIVKSEHFV